MDTIKWIEKWYLSHCDGDWEHNYGIKIETLDNPGWNLKVDLTGTKLENYHSDWELFELNEDDWYGKKIEDSCFSASGDPSKLDFILNLFKEFIEKEAKKNN